MAGTNLYKGKTKAHHGKSIARPKDKERDLGGIIQEKGTASILIGSLPLFQPGVPALEFVSSAVDYGESETGIIPRNEANNYLCRTFDRRLVSSAQDYGELETGIIPRQIKYI